MGCSSGEPCCTTSCRSKKAYTEQQLQKQKQLVVCSIVLLLFLLSWFHIAETFLGVDVALLAIFISSASIFNRALDSLLKKQLNTDVLIGIAIIAALAVPEAHHATAPWLGPQLNRLISSRFFPAGSVIVLMLGIETLEMFTFAKMKTPPVEKVSWQYSNGRNNM